MAHQLSIKQRLDFGARADAYAVLQYLSVALSFEWYDGAFHFGAGSRNPVYRILRASSIMPFRIIASVYVRAPHFREASYRQQMFSTHSEQQQQHPNCNTRVWRFWISGFVLEATCAPTDKQELSMIGVERGLYCKEVGHGDATAHTREEIGLLRLTVYSSSHEKPPACFLVPDTRSCALMTN